MFIDDDIVKKYLNDESTLSYKNDWIYASIENDKNVFEEPDASKKEQIKSILYSIKNELNSFRPFNLEQYNQLFPSWKNTVDKLNVRLLVGCQEPYDAFVREYNGILYSCYDLIRFNSYVEKGMDAVNIIRQLLTHEITHSCLLEKYKHPTDNYIEQLKFTAFNEGFAHYLAYTDNVVKHDFTTCFEKYYDKSIDMLRKALNEKNIEKQNEYFLMSNTGNYWDKFAAIAGKLYIAKNYDRIVELYNMGADLFVDEMLNN